MEEYHPRPGLAIDLKAAANDLLENYELIARLIGQTSDAHSVYTDLATAYDMMAALPSIIEQAKGQPTAPNWASNTALALLNTAIMLYVRATKTSSRHRRGFDIRPKLTPDQKVFHKKLCALRDEAIAHFGPGHIDGGLTWQIEGIFIPLDRPDDLKIMTGSRRIFHQKELQAELTAQLQTAVSLAQDEVGRRNSQLVDALNTQLPDQGLLDILHHHRVDLSDFFAGEVARDEALNAERIGIVSGHTDHR